jgi:hypothetical protein
MTLYRNNSTSNETIALAMLREPSASSSRRLLILLTLPTLAIFGSAPEAFAQQVVMQNASQNFTEAYAFPFKDAQGLQEMIATANSSSGGTRWYGCENNNYTAFYTTNIGYAGDAGDPSGFARTATGNAVLVALQSSLNGPRWYWTSDPCPSSGSPSWSYWNYNTDTAGSVDYTHSAYDPVYDQMGVTYTQVVSGTRRMVVGRIPSNFEGFTWYWNNCSNISGHTIKFVNSTFDSNGTQHLVYLDSTSGQVQYEQYTRTGGYQCINKPIGPYSLPAGSCAGCDRGTYQGLASNCLRGTWNGTIASSGSNLVIAYSTPGSGSCGSLNETRMYQSSNSGANWTYASVTGCQNTLQPRVVAAANGHFHIISTYAPNGQTQLAQVDWTSTNSGISWSGAYLTGTRSVSPLSGCYWGDYQGAAYDPTGLMFYDWAQVSGTWVGEGVLNNP